MSDIEAKVKWGAERARGAPVRFVEHVPIVETFRGEVVWEGVVTVFSSRHGDVYAWAVEGEGEKEPQYVAVLNTPPVTDALTAVRVWLVSMARK